MVSTKTLSTKTMTTNAGRIIPETIPSGKATLIPFPYSIASLASQPFPMTGSLPMLPAMPVLTPGCWDPYVLAVDPVIYWTEAWLSAAVFVQDRLMEMYEDLCSVEPELGVGFQLSSQLFAHGVEQTVKLFGMWIPKAPCKPAPIISEMFELEEEALKEAMEVETEAVERAMDLATGATAAWERRTVARERPRHGARHMPRPHTARRA
jgi:hypothetical protein